MLRKLRACCLGLFLLALWPSAEASAEDRATKVAQQRASRSKRRARRAKAAAARSAATTRSKEESVSAPATTAAPSDTAARRAAEQLKGVDSEVVKEGDSSVKVMRFSGLSLEGRLKSPQLLYFVSRVQAEFARPRLPHRSFMPELDRSTRGKPF